MSHFSNQTQFLQWLQTKKFVTYKLMDQSGCILENESGIEPELVAPKIENCIDLLAPGIYKFEGKINTHNATTPFVASFFKVNSFSNSIEQNNSNISGNQDIEKMFEERLKIELEKRKKDDEIANLKAKVKELEQEVKQNKPDKFEEAIGKIAQYFPNIINMNPNQNSNTNNNSNISGTEDEEKIASLLEKLMKNIESAGFDIEKTLVKLSNLNPDQLKMFIPMIP